MLAPGETDMTLFYRKLANVEVEEVQWVALTDAQVLEPLHDAWYKPDAISREHRKTLAQWMRGYMRRVSEEPRGDSERKALMNQTNPKYVMRNYLAQLAIEKQEAGDSSVLRELNT